MKKLQDNIAAQRAAAREARRGVEATPSQLLIKPEDVVSRWENVTFNDTAASPPDKSPRILKEIFHIWKDSRMDSYPPTEDDLKRVCLC